MVTGLVAAAIVTSLGITDTSIPFGRAERDLTGDGVSETLSLTGSGATVDSLAVTFLIQSSGKTLYTRTWSMTRSVGFGARRRKLPDAEWHARLREYSGWFFALSKFMTPEGFVAKLQNSARRHIELIPNAIAYDRRYQHVFDSLVAAGANPGQVGTRPWLPLGRYETPSELSWAAAVWEEIRAAGVTVFEFSTGGDAITVLGWSQANGRFYGLLQCC